MGASGLFSEVRAGLYNGISQQAPILRSDSQADVQLNAMNSIVHGLYKRPPTETVKSLNLGFNSKTLFHSIIRDDLEKYIVAITPTNTNVQINVLDLDGYSYPVEGSSAYFDGADPQTDLRLTTLADYTIVSNNKVQVEMEKVVEPLSASFTAKATIAVDKVASSASLTSGGVTYTASIDTTTESAFDLANKLRSNILTSNVFTATEVDAYNSFTLQKLSGTDFDISSPSGITYTYVAARTTELNPDKYAYVYVAKGVAEQTYTVVLNDATQATYSSGNTSQATTYKTTTIAANLTSQLTSNGWNCERKGNVIQIAPKEGMDDFSIEAIDTWGGVALKAFKGATQSFKDLPPSCFDGATLKIIGSATDGESQFWVRYEKSTPTSSGTMQTIGSWKEYREPNRYHKFNYSTMPHQLVRRQKVEYKSPDNPYGIYFSLEYVAWSERLVGDEYSAPAPSFVGGYIQDLILFRNRLGVISGQSISLSRIGYFFDFFPTTVTDILDDDPMDIEASSTTASTINYALPVDKNLMLFGSEQQFILTSGDNPFTLKTAQMYPILNYSCATNTRPISTAQTVYFADPSGAYASIREYFVQTELITQEAADVTAHVPRLIPNDEGTLHIMFSSNSQNILGVFKANSRNLYIYKYDWNGNQKVQSAWSEWVLSKDYLTILAFDEELYLIAPDGMDKMDLTFNPDKVLLDNGSTLYDFKYRFSPILLPSGSGSNIRDTDSNNLLKKLNLVVTGDAELDVTLVDYPEGTPRLQYKRETEAAVSDYTLRGKTTDYTVEIGNNTEKQAVIEAATFTVQVNKKSQNI